MIQRLLRIENEALLKSIFSLLYVNALMLGHHALSNKEMSIVNNSLMDFRGFGYLQKMLNGQKKGFGWLIRSVAPLPI